MMLAKRSTKPWEPIPTITIRRGDSDPSHDVAVTSADIATGGVKCTVKNLLKHAKPLIAHEKKKLRDPVALLRGAMNHAVRAHNKKWGNSHEHADFYHPGKLDAEEHRRWLENPRRHEHGFSRPKRAMHGIPDHGPIAHDMFGGGLIGAPLHTRKDCNPYWDGHRWGNHFGDWDRAVRAWEDAA